METPDGRAIVTVALNGYGPEASYSAAAIDQRTMAVRLTTPDSATIEVE